MADGAETGGSGNGSGNGEELLAALAATPVGAALDRAHLERLAGLGSVREVAAGERLRREGEPGGTLMVLLAGAVEVIKDGRRGESRLVELGRGALLGEVGFLCGRPASATLRATAPSRVFELPRDAFSGLAEAGDPAAVRLALALSRVLADRLARMNDRALEMCEEYTKELARAGVPEASARVRDLAAFRAQLGEMRF
jgi:CRP/FNR family transcriptional regulator, cyclic AMP receptor protein